MRLPLPHLTFLAAVSLAAAEPPVFTIESVLAGLRNTFPEASRVADDLPAGITAQEGITYASRDGRALQLDLYRPSGGRLLPAVLIVHGGGWIAGDRTMERPFAKNLAVQGFVAVPVSYRLGTPGRFPAPVYDLKEAVRWLRAHAADYGIDAAQIGVVGGSAGGTLAAMLGATNGLAALE
ncbi:MAG: alpha/beta hydrolase fold domain-containing protein, partial [Streptosporangiales bacterium]